MEEKYGVSPVPGKKLTYLEECLDVYKSQLHQYNEYLCKLEHLYNKLAPSNPTCEEDCCGKPSQPDNIVDLFAYENNRFVCTNQKLSEILTRFSEII